MAAAAFRWRGLPGLRRGLAVLIGLSAAVAALGIVLRHLVPGGDGITLLLLVLPAAAFGTLVAAAIVVWSGSEETLSTVLAHRGLHPTPQARASGSAMGWAAMTMLAVHLTAPAFAPLPGGASLIGVLLGAGVGVLAWRLHVAAIEHEAYRTVNLVAMLLAAGSVAAMAATPTGAWWTMNFSTLGTSDDLAAACFNAAVVVAGALTAVLGPTLSRSLLDERFGPRRGGATALRVLIAVVGLSLVGVGLVPIDTDTVLHNAFACAAAAGFAIAALGVPVFVRRPPRRFVAWSILSIGVEIAAMIAYDAFDLFNLTVFELTAFSLVFAWLIAMVVMTASTQRERRSAERATPDRAHRAPHRMPRRDARIVRRPASTPKARRHPATRRHAGRGRRPSRTALSGDEPAHRGDAAR
ncbi:DUF998 domain-containing protein [Agromyces sp. MMS24-JH15]|uniref:DUF998 domain-containing protein n=1 Tax=Agromyces sp. MMS24-JH15 TaxID=3243765 RepID=UPI003747BB23